MNLQIRASTLNDSKVFFDTTIELGIDDQKVLFQKPVQSGGVTYLGFEVRPIVKGKKPTVSFVFREEDVMWVSMNDVEVVEAGDKVIIIPKTALKKVT